MDPKTRQAKRRRLTENGNYVTHSEIVRRRGGTNITSFRNFGANGTEIKDGGRAVMLADTSAYKSYVLYMAPRTSIGKKQIEGGNKTVVVNTGILFISVEKKGPGRGNKYKGEAFKYSSGQVLNLKKGQRYTYSTGNAEAELMIIEGGDLTEKVLEEPIANLDGAQQFQLNRNPGVDMANVKQRKRMTKEEREAYGQAYAASRGHMTQREKNILAKDIARGNRNTDASHTVVGVNPTPIGNIGDDYIPTE
jgi:hypothetical protein